MSAGFTLPAYLSPLDVEGESFVRPSFDGYGLANIAPTVLQALTGSGQESTLPSLSGEVLPSGLLEEVHTIVLLLADGLGDLQLKREAASGNAPALKSLLESAASGDEGASYATLTSVFPSTTVAALGSVNSGVAPVGHGLLGYTQHVPELGGVTEMIRWGPLDRTGSFMDARHGLHRPEAFFWAPTIYQQLVSAGVARAFAVNSAAFAHTALTRMLQQGSVYRRYVAPSSIAALVPELVAQSGSTERSFIFAYWPTVDTVAHYLGPESAAHSAEVAVLDRAIERLLDHLAVRGDTLLLLTADHGHIQTSPSDQVFLDSYPQLTGLLAQPPAGERRAVYLHARGGAAHELEACAREVLAPYAATLSRADAIALGLFGPEPIPERARERIGDVVLLARGAYQLTFHLNTDGVPEHERLPPPPDFRGVHGGLSAEEALVPLLALRV